jgi:hypothetical protein
LQAGIASEHLFTSLVLVALITTIMTAPLLSWIDRREGTATRRGQPRRAITPGKPAPMGSGTMGA